MMDPYVILFLFMFSIQVFIYVFDVDGFRDVWFILHVICKLHLHYVMKF